MPSDLVEAGWNWTEKQIKMGQRVTEEAILTGITPLIATDP